MSVEHLQHVIYILASEQKVFLSDFCVTDFTLTDCSLQALCFRKSCFFRRPSIVSVSSCVYVTILCVCFLKGDFKKNTGKSFKMQDNSGRSVALVALALRGHTHTHTHTTTLGQFPKKGPLSFFHQSLTFPVDRLLPRSP